MSPTAQQSFSVSFTVVGDSYVDLFCFLEGALPELGGDAVLTAPVEIFAGGSTINTATHLSMLVRSKLNIQRRLSGEDEATADALENGESIRSQDSVVVQTMLNPNDEYGQILLRHASSHELKIINCCSRPDASEVSEEIGCDTSMSNGFRSGSNSISISNSSPHCVVMVSGLERSFMSHRGCSTSFTAWDLQLNNMVQTNGPVHLHVAGFFCTPGFAEQSLREQLVQLKATRSRRWPNQPTIVSLVTQFDVSEKWDGGLVQDIIPLLSVMIMNELEAGKIIAHNSVSDDAQFSTIQENGDIAEKSVAFFSALNRNAVFVVTKGVKGAVAFRNGEIIGKVGLSAIVKVVDPTGAGDAFAAGFLFGLWEFSERSSSVKVVNVIPDEAIPHALLWGCTLGTAAVTIRGASVPSTVELLARIHTQLSMVSFCDFAKET
jgi:sugar/nucleoside kinase (ribokinase family)